jgi:hypothetical protein
MSCRNCGLLIRKGDRFILVGSYPGKLKKFSYYNWWDGPEYFGELYHEACYLRSLRKQEMKQKKKDEGVES